MKILMLATGTTTHAQRQLRWLLAEKHDVLFVDPFDPLPTGANGYSFFKLGQNSYFLDIINLFSYEFCYKLKKIFIFKGLKRKIQNFNPDIAHVHFLDDRARYISELEIKPFVISIWGTDINACFLKSEINSLSKARGSALRLADKVIIGDLSMEKKCQALAGQKLPIEYLHLGTDIDFFKSKKESAIKKWRLRLKIDEDDIVILSPRIWERKYNHIDILEVLAKLPQHFENKKFVFLFKRAFSNTLRKKIYEKKFEITAKKLGIWENVRLIDQVPFTDIPIIYKLSHLVVNFPRIDSFPITFPEAALCNCLVVSCLLPSYKGTFVEKYYRTVKPGNLKALGEAIVAEISNLGNPDQIFRIKQAALEAQKYYDENIYKEKIILLYKDLIINKEM